MIEFALAIPTCAAWLPERAASLDALRDSLGSRPKHYREFGDRESNRVWPTKLWRWGLDSGATHLVQLQDDVQVAPNFWPALRAMVEARPYDVVGLHANHPLAPVQFRAGRRWYRDRWLTGPAYVFPAGRLEMFLSWCDLHPELVASTNEDSLICKWAVASLIDIWHPVPTITDVDQATPSTYGNDDHHEWSMYRRPPVTWRDATSLAALEDPSWWACNDESAPMLPGSGTQTCWYCATNDGPLTSAKTGARICKHCLAAILGSVLSRAP